jgi:FkbM family methyltransferase
VKFFDRIMSQDSILLDMPRPMESYLVAGGYLFGRGAMFDEVPYDPHIYFIGEEIAHAARYYTNGWDGYTPHKCLIHHYYSRKSATKHWQDEKEAWTRLNLASYRRVRHVLEIERTADPMALAEIEKYGLGSRRSLDEFQAAIGVNFNAQVIDRKRQESVAGIEAMLAVPRPPQAAHEIAALIVLACRHGQMLFPKLDAYIGKSLKTYGEWTEGITRLCQQIFPAGQTVLEIGAGWGTRTLALARMLGAEGKVIAVEQSRRLTDLLHANLALNTLENVQIVHARAAALPGAVEVIEPNFDIEGNFGAVAWRKATEPGKSYVEEIVLDRMHWGPIDALVIDTPGCTHEVIAGAQSLLATHKPLIVANADNVDDAGKTREKLRAEGYRLWSFSSAFFAAANYFRCSDNVFGNLASYCTLAVPDDRDLTSLRASRI